MRKIQLTSAVLQPHPGGGRRGNLEAPSSLVSSRFSQRVRLCPTSFSSTSWLLVAIVFFFVLPSTDNVGFFSQVGAAAVAPSIMGRRSADGGVTNVTAAETIIVERDTPACSPREVNFTVSPACDVNTFSRLVIFYWMDSPPPDVQQIWQAKQWQTEKNYCLPTAQDVLPAPIHIHCDNIPYGSSIGIGFLSANLISCAICCSIAVWTYFNRHKQVIQFSQSLFCISFSLAAAIDILGGISFLGESDLMNCQLRPWLYHPLLTLTLSILFNKLYRISVLFSDENKLKRVTLTNKSLVLRVVAMVCFDIFLMALWVIISPPVPTDQTMPVTGLHLSGINFADPTIASSDKLMVIDIDCLSPGTKYFRGILMAWKVAILGYGGNLARKSWHVDSKFAETRQISIACYIAIAIGVGALVFGVMDMSIVGFAMVKFFGTILVAIMPVLFVMVPKIYLVYTDAAAGRTMRGESTANRSSVTVSPPGQQHGGAGATDDENSQAKAQSQASKSSNPRSPVVKARGSSSISTGIVTRVTPDANSISRFEKSSVSNTSS